MCRRMMYLFVVIMLGLTPASLVYGFDPGSPDLMAWWACDEGAGAVVGDVSGNGNHGIFVNGDPAWVEGISGSAVQLVGPTLIEVPPLNVELTEATMAGWIKPDGSQPEWASIIMHRNPGPASGFNILGYQLAYHWNDTSDSWSFRGGDMIAEDDWTFAAVTVAPDNATFYVNGVAGSVNTVSHAPVMWDGNIYLGGDGGADWVARRMNGALDDVSFFSRALTADEIVAVMEGVEPVDMEIGFTVKPPVIDGEVDFIWDGASSQYFVPLDDPANGSGSWKALYDSENLYVIVDVTDDSLQNDSDGSWQDDSVELYFDGGNTKLDTPLAGDDHQYTFGWTTEEIQGTNIDGATEGFEHAQVDTDTGWRIEIKMPWLSLQGAAPQSRDLIGIDCYYNDDDDGGDSRENKMLGFSTVEGWNDASQWGTAMLAVIPEPVDPGTDGLLVYYGFENDVNDSSGNALDGIVVGDPVFVEGVEGMALDFNGDDYVDCGTNDVLNNLSDAMTVSAWVNIRSVTTTWMGIVMKGETAWRLGVNGDTTSIHFGFTGGDRGWQAANSVTELPLNEWHHIAGTYDRSAGGTVHIDGVAETVNPDPDGVRTNEISLLLGENPEALGRLFDGMLDEVRIYNRAVSEGEMLYLAGMRMPVVGPVHSFTFEDGTGNDSVGGADGVLVGDAAIVDGSLVVDGDGDWMDMPGDVIAINTYSATTLELWSTQSVDNAFSMTASFGGTWDNGMGKDYICICTGRGDQMNRGSIANTPDEVNPWEDEVGISSPELNDGIEHHYVLTITAAELAYYVDGVLIGTAPMGDTTIGGVSNDFVYLGKGIYGVDPTMNCSINEFNIYDVALDDAQIAENYAAGPVK